MTEQVLICVQGDLFSLTKDMILRHDWMVAKILTSGVPFDTADGLPYLDVDPVSFRMIVCILQGGMKMDGDLEALASPELALLRATARYLNCGGIKDGIDSHIKSMPNDLSKAILNRNRNVIANLVLLDYTKTTCERKRDRLQDRCDCEVIDAEIEEFHKKHRGY
jgi:hypothetical protein